MDRCSPFLYVYNNTSSVLKVSVLKLKWGEIERQKEVWHCIINTAKILWIYTRPRSVVNYSKFGGIHLLKFRQENIWIYEKSFLILRRQTGCNRCWFWFYFFMVGVKGSRKVSNRFSRRLRWMWYILFFSRVGLPE